MLFGCLASLGVAASLPLWLGGDTRSRLLAFNSLCLAAGACAIALPWGTLLAVLLVRTDMPGRRPALLLLAGMVFVPLYLQAAGWQAGFGLGGCFVWGAGSAVVEPFLSGWRGAVWIHSVAAVPWVTLIVGLGLTVIPAEWEEQALLDGTPLQVFRTVTLRRVWGPLGIAALWVLVTTTGEMTVTDIFQIRTYAEELYTGFALGGDLLAAPLGVLPGMIIVAWLTMAALVVCWYVLPRQRLTQMRPPYRYRLGRWQWPAALFTLLALLIVVGVPLANLVYQAGVVASDPAAAEQPTWSLRHFVVIVGSSPLKHRAEFGWTMLTGGLAAAAAIAIAIPLGWLGRRDGASATPALAVTAFCLAVPGPLVGMALVALLSQPDAPALTFLRDRTLFSPWAAQVVRSLPLTVLIVWQAFRTIPRDTLEMARVDGAGVGGQLLWVALPQRWGAVLGAGLVAAAIAMGDVAATASDMVVPPGIDLLSRRVAGMLHASVYDEIAGICLTNAALFVAIAAAAMWFLTPPRRRRRVV